MDWQRPAERVVDRLLRRSKRTEGRAATDAGLLIVRRGLSPVFYFFCEAYAKEHGLAVVPDRRDEERRRQQKASAAERRMNDRRRAARTMWEQGDFLVVSTKRSD